MRNEQVLVKRIRQLADEINDHWYRDPVDLRAEYIHDRRAPIPYEQAVKAGYRPIRPGKQWGRLWDSAWFRFSGTVPGTHAGREVVALLELGGEGCVFVDGAPYQGITSGDPRNLHWTKRLVPLYPRAKGGEKVSLLVEAAANGLFGGGKDVFHLGECRLAWLDRAARGLEYDVRTLLSLTEQLPEGRTRRERVLRGLNEVADAWAGGDGIDECLGITKRLLAPRADAGAPRVYSIGHAHLDLGWLWPTRETRRKGGRTFSTALRLMEEYPEYRFGASQAQLYEWVRESYPRLFDRVRTAVKRGQWECQGAMWVEPDMNLAGGEALVRQCLYGKGFFEHEFGVDVRNLWLPDVFGYSAALPQILKKCGVDVFMTQKISWNDTNRFPHHTFRWQGIDGTEILSHFLPADTYNGNNWPGDLVKAERKFSQSAVSDAYLNLYGVGDGGGGPSRAHVELGLRQRNLEGAPRFTFATAETFFKRIMRIPREDLPVWAGELYLECHRGTYTTQALMKKYNRLLELRLRDVELLGVLAGDWPKRELDRIWKNTLLNQFHDILPGSSIPWVYEDAHAESAANLEALDGMRERALAKLHGPTPSGGNGRATYVVYNTLGWDRRALVRLPGGANAIVNGPDGAEIPSRRAGNEIECEIELPSMGHTSVTVAAGAAAAASGARATRTTLENECVKVRLGGDGTIESIYDKTARRETLEGPANVLLLWEDKPPAFDAWNINPHYRGTKPEQARRESIVVEQGGGLSACVRQRLRVGESTIEQRIRLSRGSTLIRIENTVDWREEHKMLRVGARPAVHAHEASYEIQFGTIRRPTHRNTSWDRARFEVAGHRFADLSQPDYGFAIVNDCKYGHAVYGNTMELDLLRSPTSPDPKADRHRHTFTYGYYPHTGDLVHSDVLQTAHALNSPPIVRRVRSAPGQPRVSHYRVDGGPVVIETVKRAENGRGTVLRLYEAAGTSPEITLQAARQWQSVHESDMLEHGGGRLCGAGRSLILRFKPFEIKTLVARD